MSAQASSGSSVPSTFMMASIHTLTLSCYIFIDNWASEASLTLGCSIEISRDWASEASPILGCSIEISRDIIGKRVRHPLLLPIEKMFGA